MTQRDQQAQNQNPYPYRYDLKNKDRPTSQLGINMINRGNQARQAYALQHNMNSDRNFQIQTGNAQGLIPIAEGQMLYYGNYQQQTCSRLQSCQQEDNENYWAILGLNIGILVVLILFIVLIGKETLFCLFIVFYVIYFLVCAALADSPLWKYFDNMKEYSQLSELYSQLRQTSGNIKFKAQCFHYTGRKTMTKTVTHTAVQIVPIRQCLDINQNLPDLKEDNKFLFCKLSNYYCFADVNSHNAFIDAYSLFKINNTRDTYQIFSHELDIPTPGLIGVSVQGKKGWLKPSLVISLILFLIYPYSKIIEHWSKRYSISIIKKVTI